MAFEGLSERLSAAFKALRRKGRLSENDIKEAMREIRLTLLEADVNFRVVKDFVKRVGERSVGADVLESLTPAQMVIKIVNEELTALMGGETAALTFSRKPPTIYMLVGLQGAGKTTNGAKLAAFVKKTYAKRPLLVACDIYRPAAIQQLKIVGEKLSLPVFEMGQTDPLKIAEAALRHASDHGNDVLFFDTAGRLHIDETMMEELKSLKTFLSPTEILLVVDAMTGQDAVSAAEAFNNALSIDGIIMTKLDGDARGGAALSARAVTGRPVKFAGVGEKLTDIEPFHPDRMASRILGMGDVLTLIEKAEQAIDEEKAIELEKKLRQDRFTLEDFLGQMEQIRGMGSIADMAGMLPGVDAKALKNAQIDEKAIGRTEAIILSMTPAERENPQILNSSRKRRIARGSGTRVEDLNRLLKQFEMIRQMTKQMSRAGKKKGKKLPFSFF